VDSDICVVERQATLNLSLVAFLFRQQHLDRVHMSFSLHLAKVNSARKPNGIPSEPVNTPSIISLSQNFNLSPEEIKNFQ
jgi:hypothetical protein